MQIKPRKVLASYREGVAWIAEKMLDTDENGETYQSTDHAVIEEYPCTHMLAHLFQKLPAEVAIAVMNYRKTRLPNLIVSDEGADGAVKKPRGRPKTV